MKKLLFTAFLAACISFGTSAQTTHGNSVYGHSHKKGKKAKKHHKTYNPVAAQRHAMNEQHKTAIHNIKADPSLSNQQKKEQVHIANVTHKQQMQTFSKGRK